MSWKVALVSVVAISAGFFVVSKMTSKPKVTVGGNSYRFDVYQDDGGHYAQIFVNDKPGQLLGPLPTEDAAQRSAADYLMSLDAVAFYSLRTEVDLGSDDKMWYFDGWSRGTLIVTEGPFADEEAASVAAKSWAAKAAALQLDGGDTA